MRLVRQRLGAVLEYGSSRHGARSVRNSLAGPRLLIKPTRGPKRSGSGTRPSVRAAAERVRVGSSSNREWAAAAAAGVRQRAGAAARMTGTPRGRRLLTPSPLWGLESRRPTARKRRPLAAAARRTATRSWSSRMRGSQRLRSLSFTRSRYLCSLLSFLDRKSTNFGVRGAD